MTRLTSLQVPPVKDIAPILWFSSGRRQCNRPWTSVEDGILMSLHRQGYNHLEIARLLNRTRQAVWARIKVIQGRRTRPVWSPEEDCLLRALASCRTLTSTARALKRPRDRVSARAAALGVVFATRRFNGHILTPPDSDPRGRRKSKKRESSS